ncbi:MAG TPA: hypothetical protein VEY95_06575 [Azospirillaceae bacterium]|nr:hypothetical protein [Azospirillaceae bacterium]
MILLAAAALAAAIVIAGRVLFGADAAPDGGSISLHGFLALGLGILGTLALAGLLLALVFHSHKAGYDDRASRTDD